MELTILKDYLQTRPYIDSYSDLQLQKAVQFSERLIDLFFDIKSIKNISYYQFAVCEQAIYILQNNPTQEYITKYQGLSQFNVGGAIQGTVLTEYLSFISPLAKAFLKKVGCEMVVGGDRSKIDYSYTTF